MAGIFWVNFQETGYFAHEIFLLPGQMIVEHGHEATAKGKAKMESWHVRHGLIYTLGEEGGPLPAELTLPKSQEKFITVSKCATLYPGDIRTLNPRWSETLHGRRPRRRHRQRIRLLPRRRRPPLQQPERQILVSTLKLRTYENGIPPYWSPHHRPAAQRDPPGRREAVQLPTPMPTRHKIELLRFEPGSPMPALIQSTPHVAFTVENLDAALVGKGRHPAPVRAAPGFARSIHPRRPGAGGV